MRGKDHANGKNNDISKGTVQPAAPAVKELDIQFMGCLKQCCSSSIEPERMHKMHYESCCSKWISTANWLFGVWIRRERFGEFLLPFLCSIFSYVQSPCNRRPWHSWILLENRFSQRAILDQALAHRSIHFSGLASGKMIVSVVVLAFWLENPACHFPFDR